MFKTQRNVFLINLSTRLLVISYIQDVSSVSTVTKILVILKKNFRSPSSIVGTR